MRAITIAPVLLALAACGSQPKDDGETLQGEGITQVASLATIQSASIDLPADEETFGKGPQAELLNRTCLACHSASMVRYQPPLNRKQWTATVDKMREAYAAPFEKGEREAIVDALMATAPSRK